MDLTDFTELRESDVYRARIDVSVPPCDCEYKVVTTLTETFSEQVPQSPQVNFRLKAVSSLTFVPVLTVGQTLARTIRQIMICTVLS